MKALLPLLLLTGCACPSSEYRAVPAFLVPIQPTVEIVQSNELICLNDETYLKLAKRDRACWRYAGELRALLGTEESK